MELATVHVAVKIIPAVHHCGLHCIGFEIPFHSPRHQIGICNEINALTTLVIM